MKEGWNILEITMQKGALAHYVPLVVFQYCRVALFGSVGNRLNNTSPLADKSNLGSNARIGCSFKLVSHVF